jgi:hypothetical protein
MRRNTSPCIRVATEGAERGSEEEAQSQEAGGADLKVGRGRLVSVEHT